MAPHLDDAVLSCGATIATLGAVHPPTVATVFAGSPRPGGDCPRLRSTYLGLSFSDEEIAESLTGQGLTCQRLAEPELLDRAAGLLYDDRLLGWFQGARRSDSVLWAIGRFWLIRGHGAISSDSTN